MSRRPLRSALVMVGITALVAVCFGAARSEATPARSAAVSRSATSASVVGDVASFILSNISSTLVGDATNAGLGQLLSAVGLGDDTGAQLTEISNQLNQINGKLDALSNQVSQVLNAVQQGTCASLSAELAQTRSTIDVAWDQYAQITTLTSQVARRQQAKTLLSYLAAQINFPADELEIHNMLVSPGAGAEGLITACGQAVQSPTALLTASSALPVREVLQFWQGYEAKLLLLQTESLTAHGQRAAAKAAVQSVESNLRQETKMLLPAVPNGYFYDKKTERLWFQAVPLVPTYAAASAYASNITQTQKRQWHIPDLADIDGLVADCCPGINPTGSGANALENFYGTMTRLSGVKLAPVAGSSYAAQVVAAGGTAPTTRIGIPPVINGFSNVNNSNIGGYVFIWYHLGNRVRYAY